MTFFYFVNCCALSYGPYVMLYKKSVLSEYQPYRVSTVEYGKFGVFFENRNSEWKISM